MPSHEMNKPSKKKILAN
jgi:hypothetical protein